MKQDPCQKSLTWNGVNNQGQIGSGTTEEDA